MFLLLYVFVRFFRVLMLFFLCTFVFVRCLYECFVDLIDPGLAFVRA